MIPATTTDAMTATVRCPFGKMADTAAIQAATTGQSEVMAWAGAFATQLRPSASPSALFVSRSDTECGALVEIFEYLWNGFQIEVVVPTHDFGWKAIN
jgi:hypothetical protein